MAQLFRVSKLYDSGDSQTFTFVLPSATARDYPPEILSRDFAYAGHKWRISLVKEEHNVGVYIRLCNAVGGLRCTIDFSFTLIHRRSFTDSEQYGKRQCEFNIAQSLHGLRNFITLHDLRTRQFSDARGEFLLELNMKNVKTCFEQTFALTTVAGRAAQNGAKQVDNLDYQRYDASPVSYGENEWVCVFCPNMDDCNDGVKRHMVQLNRSGRSDTLCKLRYRITLGQQQNENVKNTSLRTEICEEIFDFIGKGEAVYFTDDYFRYVHDGNRLQLTLELYSLTYVNHMKLNILSTEKRPVAQCFDRDRQTWCLTTVVDRNDSLNNANDAPEQKEDAYLTLNLSYPDIQNIPKNYLRFVSWSLHVLPAATKKRGNDMHMQQQQLQPFTAVGAPFEHYYSQLEADIGFIMRTKLPMNEICENKLKWLDDVDQRLTIQLEWLGSHLLLHPAYHAYDDVYRKHIIQMRREVQALQAENGSLEKQLQDFQSQLGNKICNNGSDTPTRPRTASVSSKDSGAGTLSIPQGPPSRTPSFSSGIAAMQVQTSQIMSKISMSEGVDHRSPSRSSSGIDVTVECKPEGPFPDSRNGTPTKSHRASRREDDSFREPTYRDAYMGESEETMYSPTHAQGPGMDRYAYHSSSTRQRGYYGSPTKKPVERKLATDAPVLTEADYINMRRAGSKRSTASPKQQARLAEPTHMDASDYSDEDDSRGHSTRSQPPVHSKASLTASACSEFAQREGYALVRSKSASPYQQRHPPPGSHWKGDAGPVLVDEGARMGRRPYPAQSARPREGDMACMQLRPEAAGFGDHTVVKNTRHRSFRAPNDRRCMSPRPGHQQRREAEDADVGIYDYHR